MAGRSVEHWLSVSEASRALGMSRTTLLAAEESGLITPMRTPGGHRRYSPAELERYLEHAGVGASGGKNTPEQAPPEPAGTPVLDAVALAAAIREAIRPLVQALDAASAGVYLLRDGSLRFCAAFGIPRWLAERLAETDAPPVITQALDARRHRLFDPAAAAFPEPRATGQGLATALRRDDDTLGVLFLVSPEGRDLLPGELRVVDAFQELVTVVVADQRRIADLEHRLARIAALIDR
jgi:excisionase family DNA binding protein